MKHFVLFLVLIFSAACQAVPLPTQTNTSTPTLASETPIHYKLGKPEPDELLKLIDTVLLMEEQLPYDDDLRTAVLGREANSLHHLIGEDFERYYLDGFSHADELVTPSGPPWNMKWFGDLSSFSPVLKIALLEYINNHQDLLEKTKPFQLPGVNIRTFSMDLTGNGSIEWLVGAEYEEYSLQNWLLIKKQADGLYHFLPVFNYDLAGIQDYITDIEVRDLTGDGADEIIKIQHYYLAGNIRGEIDVYTWNKDHLFLFESIPLPSSPPIYGESSDYTIDDFDGDAIAEIRVDTPQFRRFGCEWTKSSVYYLNGRSPDTKVTGEEIPRTDVCLLARAIESDNSVEQIHLYQEAITKFDTSISPVDELAWIRLRLAMAYAASGDDSHAISQLEELNSTEGEGNFLNFIKDTYASASWSSPLDFCDFLYASVASQIIPESLGSEIDINLTHHAYPVDYSPLPDLICPFPDVIRARLDKLVIPIAELPIDALTTQGYIFDWQQALNLDDDAAQEWVGVLQSDTPILLLLNDKENWEIKTIPISSLRLSNFEAALYTPADVTEKVILILFEGDGKFCDFVEKQLITIHPVTFEYEQQSICDSLTYSLTGNQNIERVIGEFSKPYYLEINDAPDWYYLPETSKLTSGQKTILELTDELQDEALNQVNPLETMSMISTVIESLPEGDPVALILITRLYYMRGLNYELSHQEELAVEAYRDLIAFSPHSLWSQYAQMRIRPAQP